MACAGTIRCEPPRPNMHSFAGVWNEGDEKQPLSLDQLLLRGAKLKNTEFIIGCVIYTGVQTKLRLNANEPRFKRSHVESVMNSQIIMILVFQFLLVVASSLVSVYWQKNNIKKHWYLDSDDTSSADLIQLFFINVGGYYILYNIFVPISLYVSLELVKVAQTLFINWDLAMYDPGTDGPAQARTSGLNEELGQIEYVFSDKTGTLTQNLMTLYKFSAGGIKYGVEVDDDNMPIGVQLTEDEKAIAKKRIAKLWDTNVVPDLVDGKHGEATKQCLRDFFLCLTVCHDCETQKHGNNTVFVGPSVDEIALLEGAVDVGFTIFRYSKTEGKVEIPIVSLKTPWGEDVEYEILNSIAFTSARALMSVIAKRTTDGKIFLFSKGSDVAVRKRSIPEDNGEYSDFLHKTETHTDAFASTGLRTLFYGVRELPETMYSNWAAKYKAASEEVFDRKNKMEAVAEEIEVNLTIVGSSAIEDALQVGVADAILQMRQAGIKVWVLTGDKRATAVNIGKTSGLIDDDLTIRYLEGKDRESIASSMDNLLRAIDGLSPVDNKVGAATIPVSTSDVEVGSSKVHPSGADDWKTDSEERAADGSIRPTALVVNGDSFTHITSDEHNRLKFLELANHAQTRVVVASRMAPKQKAEVVELIKNNLGAITLAIGDGANDVSMIQAAHVGIGIRGKEGLQAANNSDYAISQFRFLVRLLFVHGWLSYSRNIRLILYSFFKNIMLTFTQVWFNFFSAWAAQSLYGDGFFLNTYNLFYTSLPIMVISTLDRDLNPNELGFFPDAYEYGRTKSHFHRKAFFTMICMAVLESIPVFFVTWYSIDHLGYDAQSVAVFATNLAVVTIKAALITTTWTIFHWLAIAAGIGSFLFFAFVFQSASMTADYPAITGVVSQFLTDYEFWLGAVLVIGLSLTIHFSVLYVYHFYSPQFYHWVWYFRRVLTGGSCGCCNQFDEHYEPPQILKILSKKGKSD